MFPNQTALSETSLLGVSTLKAASKQKASHKIKAFVAITITVDNNNHRRTLGVLLILKVAEKLKGGFTIQH